MSNLSLTFQNEFLISGLPTALRYLGVHFNCVMYEFLIKNDAFISFNDILHLAHQTKSLLFSFVLGFLSEQKFRFWVKSEWFAIRISQQIPFQATGPNDIETHLSQAVGCWILHFRLAPSPAACFQRKSSVYWMLLGRFFVRLLFCLTKWSGAWKCRTMCCNWKI